MTRIGLLSDTHGSLLPEVVSFLDPVDEVWHAGDIGDPAVIRGLEALHPVRAVFGNIDGQAVRSVAPEYRVFTVEEVGILLIHIGGYPGKYTLQARGLIERHCPKLFVCGHSHILKVMWDPRYDLLHINPGAAGKFGMHRSVTAVRFTLDGPEIRDLEVLDIPR